MEKGIHSYAKYAWFACWHCTWLYYFALCNSRKKSKLPPWKGFALWLSFPCFFFIGPQCTPLPSKYLTKITSIYQSSSLWLQLMIKQNNCPQQYILSVSLKMNDIFSDLSTSHFYFQGYASQHCNPNNPNVEPKRPSKPINITQLCRLSPTVANHIHISWTPKFGQVWTNITFYWYSHITITVQLMDCLCTVNNHDLDKFVRSFLV